MSSLLLSSNRSYLRIPFYILYRHLSTIERVRSDHPPLSANQSPPVCCNSLACKPTFEQKRFITLHVPGTDERPPSAPQYDKRAPFQFPPGNAKDKPRMEHLRFIEEQLKQVVSLARRARSHARPFYSSCQISASACTPTHSTQPI